MPAVTRYQCAICGALYDDESGMTKCEALGQPERPRWLNARIGKSVAGFDRNGVHVATLTSVIVLRREFAHELVVTVNPWMFLSHNQGYGESDELWIGAIDPMRGCDVGG